MQSFFSDYLHRLKELINDFETALSGVPQEGLDWVPGEQMNSLCVLAVHSAEATRYWVGVAISNPPPRDRPAEFEASGISDTDLIRRLREVENQIEKWLQTITLEDLPTEVESPLHGSSRVNGLVFSTGWALLHGLEHLALHVGHAQITRQLWDHKQS